MASVESHVEIGYLEKSESFKLESRFFPSKVGGKPAWLDLKNISVDVSCGVCRKPCIFLCQLYAPIEKQNNAYHRSIYVFVCRDPECYVVNKNGNFKVFRCQLAKKNDFYDEEDPSHLSFGRPESRVDHFHSVCAVCGCLGSYLCGKCKMVRYCTKEHQVSDWKMGHKTSCGSSDRTSSNLLFPEFEIMTEPEMLEDDEELEEPEKSEEEKYKEYEELVREGRAGTLADVPSSVLEQLALKEEDKYFKKFKSRLSICPDQVVRYERGGIPLWIATPNLTEDQIPNCEICQAPREFEFQILSTLLNYLNVDSLDKSIDWGTLLIYTCKNSCEEGPAYKQEFLWKQDIL